MIHTDRSLADLRDFLATDRAELVASFATADDPDPIITELARVHGALAAIDAVRLDQAQPIAARVRVRDVPGEPLALVFHGQDGSALTLAVPPLRALALAVDMIEAARRRLNERDRP